MFIISCDRAAGTFHIGLAQPTDDIQLVCADGVTTAQALTAITNFTTWLNRTGNSTLALSGDSGTITP
jgi:hypothetical protein